MYVTTVQIQAKAGKSTQAGEYAIQMRDLAKEATGEDFLAWSVVLGAPIGAFSLSTRSNDLEHAMSALAKVRAHPGYQKMSDMAGELLVEPAVMRMGQVVAATTTEPPQQFVNITSATMVGGKAGKAVAWSGEMLEFVTNVTGTGGALVTSDNGNIFEVGWIFGAATAAEVEANLAKANADPDYMAKIDEAGEYFIPGSAHRWLSMQLP